MDDEPDPELAAIRARKLRELAAPPPDDAPARAPASGEVLELTDATLHAAIAAHPRLVLDCWAPWCGPCHMLAPIVKEVARDLAGTVTFGKLDVDENPSTSRAFGVQSIPTLLFFENGRYANRLVGAYPKPGLLQALRQVYRLRGDGGIAVRP